MAGHTLILRVLAIAVPLLAAIVATLTSKHSRVTGFIASLVSVVLSAVLLRGAPPSESLDEALMLLFSCLTLGATLVVPRRDFTSGTIGGILFLLGSTLLAYSAEDLVVFLVAWVFTTVPFFLTQLFSARTWRPRTGLMISTIALAGATGLIAAGGHDMSIENLKGQSPEIGRAS